MSYADILERFVQPAQDKKNFRPWRHLDAETPGR